MRFARLRTSEKIAPSESGAGRLAMITYNAIWWLPMVSAVLGVIEYDTAFLAFLALTAFRAALNYLRNNVLSPEVAVNFPLRLP